jgi:HMG (high mobility group) box
MQQQQEDGNLDGPFPVDIMSSFDPCCDEDISDTGEPIDVEWAGDMKMAAVLDDVLSETGTATTIQKRKQEKKTTVITAKKAIPIKKESSFSIKDRPKRALTAYNLFFREERKKIGEETFPVAFEQAGKIIGARWKKITPQEKAHYERLAAHEKWRFNMAMGEWSKARMEAKSRDDAAAAAAESTAASAVDATTSVSNEADRVGRSCQDAIVLDDDCSTPKDAWSSPRSSSSSSMQFSLQSLTRMQEEQIQPISIYSTPQVSAYSQENFDNKYYNYTNFSRCSDSGTSWSSPTHGYQNHLNVASGSNMNTPPAPQVTSSTQDDLLLQAPVLEFQASIGSVGSFDLGSPARRACFNDSFDERKMQAETKVHHSIHMPMSDESLLNDDHTFVNGTSHDRDVINFFNNKRLDNHPRNHHLASKGTSISSRRDESQSSQHHHHAGNFGWNMH